MPGHGPVLDRASARALLREDLAYVQALPNAELPAGRRSPSQRDVHEANLSWNF